jgi:hypothetical protein
MRDNPDIEFYEMDMEHLDLPDASGFKVNNGKSIDDIKHECISVCSQLLRAMHEQG